MRRAPWPNFNPSDFNIIPPAQTAAPSRQNSKVVWGHLSPSFINCLGAKMVAAKSPLSICDLSVFKYCEIRWARTSHVHITCVSSKFKISPLTPYFSSSLDARDLKAGRPPTDLTLFESKPAVFRCMNTKWVGSTSEAPPWRSLVVVAWTDDGKPSNHPGRSAARGRGRAGGRAGG